MEQIDIPFYYGDIPKGGYRDVQWTDWRGSTVDLAGKQITQDWLEPQRFNPGGGKIDLRGYLNPAFANDPNVDQYLPYKAMPRVEARWLPKGHGFQTMLDPMGGREQIIKPRFVEDALRSFDASKEESLKQNPFLTDYFKSQFHPDIANLLPAYFQHATMGHHTAENPPDTELLTGMLEGYNPWTTDPNYNAADPSQAWTKIGPTWENPLVADPLLAPQDMGQKAAELNWGMIRRLPPRLRAYMMEQYEKEGDRHGHLKGLGLEPKWDQEGGPGVMGGWNPGKTESGGGGGGGTPEGGTPEGGTPEGGTPEGGTPEGGTPEGDPPEGDPPERPWPPPPGPYPPRPTPNPNVPYDAWAGYPNINYPGRNNTYDVYGNLIQRGYPPYQYAHTGRQPDPMWGGGPQTWNSGWPVSNTWSGGMQPLMADDPWALTESGIQAGMLPPTMGNFFGGYWDANYPLTPQRDPTRFGDPYSESSQWTSSMNPMGAGWQYFDVERDPRVGEYYDPKRPTQDVEWGDVPYIGWQNPDTKLPIPNWYGGSAREPGDAAGEPGDTFMDRAGVTQQQYNLAQDPGGWRGGQTFGQRTGMSQEAYNASRNAASQAALPSGYGQPVQGPGQFGGAFGTFDPTTELGQQEAALPSGYGQPVQGPGQFGGAFGTFDPTTEFGQQGGEPGNAFARQMGVTQQQYNLAQDPGAWRGEQTFGERVGMSQEAYNTARSRAKFGQPVQGPGEFGGAFGTFGPDDVGSGMVHPSQRALPPPTQAAAAPAEPGVTAQPTGMGQITPGVMGGAGTEAQFDLSQNPNAWRGTQFGSPSAITPGTIGANAMQTEPVPHTPFFGAPSPITPGTLGGMGTMPQSLSSITPGTYSAGTQQQESPQGQWNYQGMFSTQQNRITPGTLGGRGTMPRRSSITPGRLGGGNMYGNQRRGY
jgi:hypothetical protein